MVIFRLLQSQRLNGVAICDHDAGIFDDLLLFTDTAIVGYQIKSERYARNFLLETELINKRLITQIAASWIQLKSSYPSNPIQIRYIFPGFPSTRDNLTSSKQVPDHKHSAAFSEYLNQYTENAKAELISHPKWGAFATRLRTESGLPEHDFDKMMRSVQLLDSHEIARNELDTFDIYSQGRIQQIKSLIP